MKKATALVLLFTMFIYRITIGQTPETPVFKNVEGMAKGNTHVVKSCDAPTGFLGVMPVENPEIPYGLSLEIMENGPAAKAGLSGEILVLSIDEKNVANWDDLVSILKTTSPGQKVVLEMGEGESIATKTVELGSQRHNRSSPKNHHRAEENYPNKPACLGVFGQTGWAENNLSDGTRVTDLVVKGAAEKAGIVAGDFITAIDGVPVETFGKLYKTIAEYNPGDRVKVDFLRSEKRFSVEATLKACDERPVVSQSQQKLIVVKFQDVKPAQPIENQPIAPQTKLALESFTAFPNPVSEEVTIRFSGEKMPTEIRLTAANGQVFFQEKIENFEGQYEQQFDLRDLPAGQVVFSVLQNGKVFSEGILVQ